MNRQEHAVAYISQPAIARRLIEHAGLAGPEVLAIQPGELTRDLKLNDLWVLSYRVATWRDTRDSRDADHPRRLEALLEHSKPRAVVTEEARQAWHAAAEQQLARNDGALWSGAPSMTWQGNGWRCDTTGAHIAGKEKVLPLGIMLARWRWESVVGWIRYVRQYYPTGPVVMLHDQDLDQYPKAQILAGAGVIQVRLDEEFEAFCSARSGVTPEQSVTL